MDRAGRNSDRSCVLQDGAGNMREIKDRKNTSASDVEADVFFVLQKQHEHQEHAGRG